MALQVRSIKNKIKSIGSIKKITKTMEMVSVSKMRRAVDRAVASHDFAVRALELLANLSRERNVSHPLLEKRSGPKTLMVIMASNKGLCGGFNVNINKAVSKYRENHPGVTVDVVCIGKQAEKIARRQGLTIIASFTEFSDQTEAHEVQDVVSLATKEYLENSDYRSVLFAYTAFIKQLTYQPTVRQLFPLRPSIVRDILGTLERDAEDPEPQSLSLYIFEPGEEAVMDKVIPLLCTSVVYQMMLESSASEHSSRMVAMKNATDNAGSLQDDLTLQFNKARQAAITQEISEIVAGAEGV